jgi:hypothetical protein
MPLLLWLHLQVSRNGTPSSNFRLTEQSTALFNQDHFLDKTFVKFFILLTGPDAVSRLGALSRG